jgi:hypothetical protein
MKQLQTFGLNSCRDLCEKLKRELNRLNAAKGREDITDHCINFSITAWHLCDWIWEKHKANDDRFLFLKQTKADSALWKTLGDFRKYIDSREPRIRVCGLIANSAKHLELEEKRWPEKNAISVPVSAKRADGKDEPITFSNIFQGGVIWTPKIVDAKGNRLDAKVEFEHVLSFWFQFVYQETKEL